MFATGGGAGHTSSWIVPISFIGNGGLNTVISNAGATPTGYEIGGKISIKFSSGDYSIIVYDIRKGSSVATFTFWMFAR